MGGNKANLTDPIVSKIYCASSQTVLTVRRRPHVVGGGGFVVTNSKQKVVFRVDGCGILGTKRELVLKDGEGDCLLLIRQKGCLVEAISVYRKWRGYTSNYEGAEKLVFSLKEPASFFVRNHPITIATEPRRCNKDWDFQINGSFPDRACNLIDSNGKIVAQVGVKKEIEELMMSKDLYHVVVQVGFDQAFVIGVIAVLDSIHEESTRC